MILVKLGERRELSISVKILYFRPRSVSLHTIKDIEVIPSNPNGKDHSD